MVWGRRRGWEPPHDARGRCRQMMACWTRGGGGAGAGGPGKGSCLWVAATNAARARLLRNIPRSLAFKTDSESYIIITRRFYLFLGCPSIYSRRVFKLLISGQHSEVWDPPPLCRVTPGLLPNRHVPECPTCKTGVPNAHASPHYPKDKEQKDSMGSTDLERNANRN